MTDTLNRKFTDYKSVREQKYKAESKSRLKNNIEKKIRTAMIGSLSTFEEKLGFLWGEDSPFDEEERAEIERLYKEARSEILDKGNGQIRNVSAELSEYDINWNRHQVEIPLRPMTKN